jgi:hypothetical protein
MLLEGILKGQADEEEEVNSNLMVLGKQKILEFERGNAR